MASCAAAGVLIVALVVIGAVHVVGTGADPSGATAPRSHAENGGGTADAIATGRKRRPEPERDPSPPVGARICAVVGPAVRGVGDHTPSLRPVVDRAVPCGRTEPSP